MRLEGWWAEGLGVKEKVVWWWRVDWRRVEGST
jgi:hypothetical protein